jgi:hypothetical protein
MKTFSAHMTLILAAFGLTATSAFGQEAAVPTDAPTELKALAESCAAHKFETVVTRITLEGKTRGSRVRICGKDGQTDADWLVTLKDSVRKTEANDELEPTVRDQIVAALKEEIASLEGTTKHAPAIAPVASMGLSHEPEPVSVPEAPPQYSTVPPLPAPLPRVGTAAAAASLAASPPLIRPRLTIRCALPREPFAGCASLRRETQLMIRADEDIAPKTSLRFLRGGDARAELDLGMMKKGEALREKLAARVCSGVLRGKVQIQILTSGRVAETLGPYALYCGS